MEWQNDPTIITLGLCLAVFRIYLETISFDFTRLPLTARVFQGAAQAQKFHRWGFYLSVAYFVTFAPEMLLA